MLSRPFGRWRNSFRKALPEVTQLVSGCGRIWIQLSDPSIHSVPFTSCILEKQRKALQFARPLSNDPDIERAKHSCRLSLTVEFSGGQAVNYGWAQHRVPKERKAPTWSVGPPGHCNTRQLFWTHMTDCSPKVSASLQSPHLVFSNLVIWSFRISWLGFFAALFLSGVPRWVLWSHQISSPWIQVLLVSSGAVNRIVQFRNDHQTPVSILSLSWGKGRMTSLAKSQICPASLVWNWVLIQAFSCFNYLFICDGDLLLLGGSHLKKKKNQKTQRHQKVLTT